MLDIQRSKLAVAKGSGSSKKGSHHYMLGKLTSVIALPIWVYLFVCMAMGKFSSVQNTVLWLESPINLTILLIGLVCGIWHLFLATQEAINDYISTGVTNVIVSFLLKIFALFSIVFLIINILMLIK